MKHGHSTTQLGSGAAKASGSNAYTTSGKRNKVLPTNNYISEPTPLPRRKSEKLGSGEIGVRLLKVAGDPTSKTYNLMDSVRLVLAIGTLV